MLLLCRKGGHQLCDFSVGDIDGVALSHSIGQVGCLSETEDPDNVHMAALLIDHLPESIGVDP